MSTNDTGLCCETTRMFQMFFFEVEYVVLKGIALDIEVCSVTNITSSIISITYSGDLIMSIDIEHEETPKPLEWPSIDVNFEENQEVTEHIHLGIKPDCFDSLLDELEFEYKHVADKLRLLIGHPEFETAINSYVVDDRGGRQGFPKKTMSLLLKLSTLHTKQHGHLTIHTDQWYNATHK